MRASYRSSLQLLRRHNFEYLIGIEHASPADHFGDAPRVANVVEWIFAEQNKVRKLPGLDAAQLFVLFQNPGVVDRRAVDGGSRRDARFHQQLKFLMQRETGAY